MQRNGGGNAYSGTFYFYYRNRCYYQCHWERRPTLTGRLVLSWDMKRPGAECISDVQYTRCSRWKQSFLFFFSSFLWWPCAPPSKPTENSWASAPWYFTIDSPSCCVTGLLFRWLLLALFWEQGDWHVILVDGWGVVFHFCNPADEHSSISLVFDDNVAVFCSCYITLHLIYNRRHTLSLWKTA